MNGWERVWDRVALCIEWVWRLLPDQCEGEGCPRKGIRGNENRVDGRLLCDDCSVHDTRRKQSVRDWQ